MVDKLLQKAIVLNQHLERYRPLPIEQERKLNEAAEGLVHALEEALKESHAPSLAQARGTAAQVEAFERLIRPFFQKLLGPLASLQNQFASSQSWFTYKTKVQGEQEVFTLDKLSKVMQSETVEALRLVSQVKHADEKNKYSARVTVAFEFEGLRPRAFYLIESPSINPLQVKIDIKDDWYSYEAEQIDELVATVGKEIRTIVWKNTY